MAEKLSAWMALEGLTVNDVRRALVELEEKESIVNMPKLKDLVRRHQLGPVYQEISHEGLVFPEDSHLYDFSMWDGRVEMRKMIEAIVSRDWSAAFAAGESIGMSRKIIGDAYSPVSTRNVFWVMKRAGRQWYVDASGVQRSIGKPEKPDWRLRASIEKFLPECLVDKSSLEEPPISLEDLWLYIIDDQMDRITKYTSACLKEESSDAYPDDLGYPEGSRLREFAKIVVSRQRVLSKIDSKQHMGLQMAMCRLHLSIRMRDESTFQEMCEFFGIPSTTRDSTYWLVQEAEIMWVLWETGHSRFVRKSGIQGDTHGARKIRPPDSIRESIQRSITKILTPQMKGHQKLNMLLRA